jgi:hypothetical protein
VNVQFAKATRLKARSDNSFSSQAYRTLSDLVYRHSRIRLGPDKKALVANRLRKRLQTLDLESYDDYCDLLQSLQDAEEVENLVDLISTNHTRFFREPEHFSFLTQRALPALVSELSATGAPLRLWSAAASSGEEPYTMAVAVAEALARKEHLAVEAGTRESGVLTVMLALHFSVECAFEVPAHFFHPPPKVDSAVLKLTRLAKPRAEVKDEARFRKVVKAGFAQRRKTLSNSLKTDKTLTDDWAPVLVKAGIDGQRRAETLSVEEFAAIERSLP